MPPTPPLPARADVVIVGGGIVGCSVAYHLTAEGITDVLLLEQHELTAGSTWHAAGLVPQLRATRNLTELARYSGDLYERLEEETGQATGFVRCGSLGVAQTPERLEELHRGASMARGLGVEVEAVSAREIADHWPLLHTDDLEGGVYLPRDARTNPVDTTMALARGARQRGARIVEECAATHLAFEGGQLCGVDTEHGRVLSERVVLCAGLWTPHLFPGRRLHVPLHAAEHYYLLTEGLDGLTQDLPVLRDPDSHAYYRYEVGDKLLVGFFEPEAKPWASDGPPEGFRFGKLRPDWQHLEPQLEAMVQRIPELADTGIELLFNGPESFTPDDNALVGEVPETPGLFVAAGFNSIGIQSAGGVGKVIAEWIRDGASPLDLWEIDVARAQTFQSNRSYLFERTTETLGLLYAMHWPHRQKETARGVRRSPIYEQTRQAGAQFGELAGWERPEWYGEPDELRYDWSRPGWFEAEAAEHRATREAVGLFDQSSFSKHLVEGPDSERFLQWVCAANLAVDVGRVVYTQWLNERGGIEADLTVTRLAGDGFLVVGYATAGRRDRAWLERSLAGVPGGPLRVHVTDVTPSYGVLGVMGPHSRELLSRVSPDDLGSECFPFGTSQEIELGSAIVRASRITYVGELGWELYITSDLCAHVWETLVAAGQDFGLRPAGYRALSSLRLEKGYREWGHDIGPDDTPWQSGLGFAVDWQKESFQGRDALLRAREQPRDRRLVTLQLQEEAPRAHHDEPVYLEDRCVGRVTSGARGHSVGSSLAMAWVDVDELPTVKALREAPFEVEIALRRYPAHAHLRPLWDPKHERIRA
ncbi:MAG: FAD-dependent oxidoreductase [Acidobacteriota bacterium]